MNMYLDKKREKRVALIKEIVNYVLTVLIAFALAFCFVMFFFQTTSVVGDSMSSALVNKDQAVLFKAAYVFKKPKRYDVIKFTIEKSDRSHEFIKRVVALPGEKVQIVGGELYVDGTILENEYITDLISTAGIADEEVVLGKDEYFVMGDNCNNSEDSRFTNVGAVTSEEIDGRIIGTIKGFNFSSLD
ncbi:MAG: signal peptidase I [Lachnospiraceae bacterium]|nr:signal peptidase I [Lachnospiraceae bacterium]